jgi:hypothetical protein
MHIFLNIGLKVLLVNPNLEELETIWSNLIGFLEKNDFFIFKLFLFLLPLLSLFDFLFSFFLKVVVFTLRLFLYLFSLLYLKDVNI